MSNQGNPTTPNAKTLADVVTVYGLRLPPFKQCSVMMSYVAAFVELANQNIHRDQARALETVAWDYFTIHGDKECPACKAADPRARPDSTVCELADHCVLQAGHEGECSPTFLPY